MRGDRGHLGRRLVAFAGLGFLLTGLLAALSFVVVALVAFTLLVLFLFAAGGLWLLRRSRIRQRLSTALVSTEQAFRDLEAPLGELDVRQRLQPLGLRARKLAADTPGRANVLLARGIRAYAFAAYWLRMQTAQALRADGKLATTVSRLTPQPAGRSRQALELNELGAQLRREGDPEQAAEQHRVALGIVRDLGDPQAEALTLNNLGLALAHAGAEEAAVRHLEQAVDVLRELGDEEHEGRVIANLGLVHRRQGHDEEAVSLLHAALDKLPPESSAYRQVEQELRRAS